MLEFSSLELMMVLLVTFTWRPNTVLMVDALMVVCVMLLWCITVLSIDDLLMVLRLIVELSMVVLCTWP